MKKTFCSTLLFLLLGSAVFAAERFSVWDAWRQAYELTEQGEKLSSLNKYPEAADKYVEARQIYLKIKNEQPEWSAATIAARLKLCSDRIAELEAKQPAAKTVSVAVQPAKSAADYQTLYMEQLKTMENLRRQLQNHTVLEKNIEQLLREKQEYIDRISVLEKQLKTRRSPTEKIPGGSTETAALRQRLETLSKQLSESEKSRSQLAENLRKLRAGTQAESSELARLKEADDAMKKRLRLLENANQLRADELENTAAELRRTESRLSRAQESIQAKTGEIKDLNDLIDKLRSGGAAVDAELLLHYRQNRTEIDRLADAVAEFREALKESTLVNDRQKQTILQLRKDYGIVATDRQQLADDNAQFRLDYRKLADDFKAAGVERTGLQNEIRSLRQALKDSLDKYEALQRRYEARSGVEVTAIRNVDAANEKLSQTADSRLQELRTLADALQQERQLSQNLTGEKNRLKDELFSARSRNLLLENELLTLEEMRRSNAALTKELSSLRKQLDDRNVYLVADHSNLAGSADPQDEKALAIFLADAVKNAEAEKDFAMAAWYYEELLKLSPQDHELAIKAVCCHLINHNQSAVQELIDLFPDRREMVFLHGLTELVKQHYPTAQNDFLKLTPADGRAFACYELIVKVFDRVNAALPGTAQNQLALAQARRILR